MTVRPSVSILALILAALPACGSPADHLSFKAPAQYGQPHNVFGMAQIWSTPDRQALMLMKLPVKADPKQALSNAGFKDMEIRKRESIKICGSQAATHLELIGERKERTHMDMVMSTAGDTSYMAMYARPEGMRADAASENAIRSLCPV